MTKEKLIALLTLKKIPNLGDSSIKKLTREVGSAEAVFKEKSKNLLKIDGIGTIKIKELHYPEHHRAAEKEIEFLIDNNISSLSYDEVDYPQKLKHCMDSPVILFSRGNIDLKNKKMQFSKV